MSILSRKSFLKSLTGASLIVAMPQLIISQAPPPVRPPLGPQLDRELVKQFVGFAHRDPDKVKVMLQETPDLLNSVNNLGAWDWEDAIGAAGHVGIRDLALFLLEQGARPTICVAAMLGQLDLVKAYITAFPAMKNAVGPHKISLVRHAKAGGEESKAVLDYLLSIDAAQ